MTVRMVGCTYHRSPAAVRERLAFSPAQTKAALADWRQRFPKTEAVLVSTCNRVELYTAHQDVHGGCSLQVVAEFLADFHGLPVTDVCESLLEESGNEAVRHLFCVAASLDSMVIGEPQVLSQVKQAYRLAQNQGSVGPVLHQAFQSAVRVARRVATETTINRRRVSIPSLAIADFASQIFERFDDKCILVVGAGDMAEETLRYLHAVGARDITVINRNQQRAGELAARWHGRVAPWEKLHESSIPADLVVSTTGSSDPIMTSDAYNRHIAPHRHQRPLMIVDLAIPRDFDPAIAECPGVYLYSIDDLSGVCQRNRQERDKELPAAMRIVDEETSTFMTNLYHHTTTPIINQLREGWQEPKKHELERLLRRLPDLDERSRNEISLAFDRLVNKLLHPPLESLRHASRYGPPYGLLDALRRLFQLKD